MKPLSDQQIKALDALAKRSGNTEIRWVIRTNKEYKCCICNKTLSEYSVYDLEEKVHLMPDIINHGNEHLKSLNIFT